MGFSSVVNLDRLGRDARMAMGGTVIPGIQFIVNEYGKKTAVVIDLRKNSELWEDFYDCVMVRRRRREPRESLAQVKSRPRQRRPARG